MHVRHFILEYRSLFSLTIIMIHVILNDKNLIMLNQPH